MDIDPQYRTQDGSALRIWKDAAQNNFLTGREGRPIFDEVIFVEVISPGSRDSTPVFEAKRTFAEEMAHPEPLFGPKYAEYRQYIEDFERAEASDSTLSGTPLKEWSEVSRTQAAAMRAANIFTVEALAALPDTKLSVVGPDGRTWRNKAIAFLAAAKDGAYATDLAAQLDRSEADKAELQGQIKDLSARIDALLAAQTTTQAPPTPPEAPAPAKAPKAAPATPNAASII